MPFKAYDFQVFRTFFIAQKPPLAVEYFNYPSTGIPLALLLSLSSKP